MKPYTSPVEREAASFNGKQNTKTSCTVNFKYVSRSDSVFPIIYVPCQKHITSLHCTGNSLCLFRKHPFILGVRDKRN